MKLFVGNLSFTATESDIRELFESHGAVDSVSLITDRETGRSRGFAFVEMADQSQSESAINALHGMQWGGRALNVNESRPKEEGGPRGRGPRR